MLDLDLHAPASVVVMPPRPGSGPVRTVRRGVSLGAAIRYVIEHLSADERSRAVVRTPHRSLFVEEIEAIYDRLGFARAA